MRPQRVLLPLALACTSALVPFAAPAQAPSQAPPAQPAAPYDVKANYTKTEYHVKMRDGVTLFTSVYAPKDTSKTYPFLVSRTCYSVAPYGPDKYRPSLGPSRAFAESGYIFVYQDVRGRYGSEGEWLEMTPHIDHPTGTQHDESTDMYDTVEWLLKTIPHNNGKVGIYGISYPGFYTSASIIDGHPAIKAASPQAPVTDLHDNDDAYHNGAFMLEANDFYRSFRPQKNPIPEPPRPDNTPFDYADAYTAYLKQWEPLSKARAFVANPYFDDQSNHPNYDSYWDVRDISRHLHNIHAAVLTVGGWFDAEDLSGPHKTFQSIAKQSPDASNKLVIGPWVHGGWSVLDGERIGDVHFGSKTGDYFRDKLQFPFFEHYLKDAPDPNLAVATVFETGSNTWKTYTAWPPAGSKPRMMYFGPHGTLSLTPSPAASGSGAYDEYVSDPTHPVPELSYTAEPGPSRDYMVADQRFAATRPDVLVYQTEPLTEDITFAGPLRARLHVSTSGTDSDFVVKLIDVYPQQEPTPPQRRGRGGERPVDVLLPPVLTPGYEQLVRGEPMRGKFRKSLAKPEPFTPNKPESVDFSLVQVNHTFLKGHRIMVQVQSSWFPLVDLNPQTFVDISNAKPEDFKPATERVFHSADLPSGIEFQALQ
ncbi:CocE/NonD family hydrolase [Granulicella tundricola]|uniref:Hydrolase CocE/NonD family protein n=1 Tax=Granulicella tundricola (strain ATCC BAA-1859 / DSM 23138 / MP5ACTX9) TaxID=1198114 RepID=E8X3W1_GRATM|nr:CocE/NonD family hydrolase [Granulicella tundricola]ADW70469.1 hydrolase CocE/NonD family protein [Granulicella tundricola MP5ACTX9]